MRKSIKKHSTPPLRPVDHHIAAWLTDVTKSPHTAEAYRRDLNAFLDATGKPFDAVTPADVNAWRDTLTGADSTLQRKVIAVRSFYNFCNSREITDVNLSRVKIPKSKSTVPYDKLLTPAEVAAIIEAAEPDVEAWLFVRLSYLCGLRVSDAMGAKWRDLLTGGKGKSVYRILHIAKGKGGKPASVPIPKPLWNDLHKHCGGASDNSPLFPGIRDRYVAARLVTKLAKAAKIDKVVTPHSFRHACVSHLLEKGAPLASVRDLARHANVSTTNRYAHGSGTAGLAEMLDVE